MGAGTAGDFGNTKGSRDNIKAALKTLGTIIDVADTINDLRSLPEDIKEKDWVSVGLDTLGIMPLVGKIVDNAKIADHTVNAIKAANKTADAAKAADKAVDLSKMPKNVHIGRQGKHIIGHNNYKPEKFKSIFTGSMEDAKKLIDKYSGTGKRLGDKRERVNFNQVIGKYVDPKTGKTYNTTIGTIHHSKDGAHIVPEKPIDWRD